MHPSVFGLHDVHSWGWTTLVHVGKAVGQVACRYVDDHCRPPYVEQTPGTQVLRTMLYTFSHTALYVMIPTTHRASVLERCKDRICQTANTNLSSM